MKRKVIVGLLLAVSVVSLGFAQVKDNHDFKSATNSVTNGIFKEAADHVLDVTGFNAVEGNIVATQITNSSASGVNATDLDLIWGKKFGGFYLGAAYSGSFINNRTTNNTGIIQSNTYDNNSVWTGSTNTTSVLKGSQSLGQYNNNAQVLFGLNNMGFKLSFDSTVPSGAKRGALGPGTSGLELKSNSTIVRNGADFTGTPAAETIYDTKGYENQGLAFMPHVDFGINLGLGMGLWATAHLGSDILDTSSYHGNTVNTFAATVGYPTPATSTNTKTYAHNNTVELIAGIEAGVVFGIFEPSLKYDFGVSLPVGKTYAVDKKTAFAAYTRTQTITNTTGETKIVENHTGAAALRNNTWRNEVAPAIKISPDFGDRVKFAMKVNVPVTFTSSNIVSGAGTGTAGINNIKVTSYSYTGSVGPNTLKKETEIDYRNETYKRVQIEVNPVVDMGMRIYTPSEKMSFNFGMAVKPFTYMRLEDTQTVANNPEKVTTKEYENGSKEVNTKLPTLTGTAAIKRESKNVTDTWGNSNIMTVLSKVQVGFTWYVNTKLTFDLNLAMLGTATDLTKNPFSSNASGYGSTVGLTATYKF